MSARLRRRFLFGLLALAVIVSAFGLQPVWGPLTVAPAAAAAPDDGDAKGPLTRPDSVSAQVTARSSGKRVEDLSQGDAFTQVFANPDGSWTSEAASEPVRAQDDEGVWGPIDLTLVKVGGRLVPKNAPGEVSLSAGGDKVFAAAVPDDGPGGAGRLAWGWPTELPEPELDGATATYEDVVPGGGDLVVTATASGFTHHVVLDERPKPGADGTVAPITYTVPVATPGAEVRTTRQGGIEVTAKAKKREVIAAAPPPVMWDSSKTGKGKAAPGDPEVARVKATVTDTVAGGRMVLAPDMDFLTDPATTYPVTIDPAFTLYTNADTWVMNTGFTSGQSASPQLRAGTYDAGAHVARSFLKFPGESTWNGTQIKGAWLKMWNFDSGSCALGQVAAQRITEAWNSTNVTWANQPAATVTSQGIHSYPHGYSSACPAAEAPWTVTSIVQGWANGTLPNYGLRVAAVAETNSNTWRMYWSNDSSGGIQKPRLVVNYNRYPSSSTLSMIPSTAWSFPNSSTVYSYTSSRTPTASTTVTDPDGGQVRAQLRAYSGTELTSTKLGECLTPYGAAGGRVSCALSQVPDNTTIYLRSKAQDSAGAWAGGSLEATAGWTAPRAYNVGSLKPTAPVVACPAPYADDTWHDTAPTANLTCTITATGTGYSAPGYIRWSLNGSPETRTKITPSPNAATARISITVPKDLGAYEITTKSESRSGLISGVTSYGFGYGPFTMSSPVADPSGRASVTTTDRVTLVAEGPTNTAPNPEPVVKWRVAGSGGNATTGWHDAGVTDYQTSTPASGKTSVTAVVDTSTFDDGNGGPNPRRPVMLELQICMPYPSTTACTWSSAPVRVLRVPHAFGGNYPVDEAGPGQVALWTGEFGLSETDATEPGYSTELGVSRSHGSFGGPGEDLDGGSAGVFGPGWTASLDGPGTGFTSATLIDGTAADGTIALLAPGGETLVWSKATPATRRTNTTLPTGAWSPADEETRLSEIGLTVNGSGASTEVEITDVDGTVTTFGVVGAVSGSAEYAFVPKAVQDPAAAGAAGETTFTSDAEGRVTRILSPTPAGVTCAASGTLADGCHALQLTYGTSGNSNDRLTGIAVVHGATSKPVTSYAYDTQGRLVGVTDERTGLTTTYTWAGNDGAAARRLASYTPPGLKTIRLAYDSDGRLSKVDRDNPTGSGTTTLQQIRYGVPTQGSGASDVGLPVLDKVAVAAWNQASVPTYGAAVFPQGAPSVDANPSNISGSDWKHARLAYTDADGRVLNTGQYGAGRWLLSATDYDENENVIRTLSPADLSAVQDGEVAAADVGTLNVYGAVKDSAGTVTIPAGTVLTETFGPAREAVITDSGGLNGQTSWVRPHTVTTYDEGAPNNGINAATGAAYGLVTRTVTRPWDPATGADITDAGTALVETRTGYDATAPGDKTGWELSAATSATTVMASGQTDIVRRTRYDAEGRVIENRQPSSNGSDAGTRQTVYYASGANAADSACGNKPQWAGLACVIQYAGGNLPSQRFTDYNADLQPLEMTESVGGTLRRTTAYTYDAAGRPAKTWVRTHGLAGSVATTGTLTEYDTATGLAATVKATDNTGAVLSGKVVTTGYDGWGRRSSYAIDNGSGAETTTASYGAGGQLSSVVDPRGTTTYTYDGTDAEGKEERRGQLTKVATSRPGAADVEFTGAYDANGTLVTHKLPGGLIQRTEVDTAGQLVSTSYSGRVNVPDENGDLVPTDDVAWLGWSQTNDIFGRTRAEWTPDGAAFNGGLASGSATGYARGYTYDRAGRLTDVVDHTAAAGGTPSVDDGVLTVPTGTECQTRSYGFDVNGNRTSLTRKGANTDGTCSSTVTSSKTWGWDGADRPTDAGYDIDALGRMTTLPAVDTPTGTGNIGIAYYDTDAVQSITQGTQTSTYALDAVGRRSTETTTDGSATTTVDLHYSDGSDGPGWSRQAANGTVKTTRYVASISGDLSGSLVSEGTSVSAVSELTLALANPHGDVVTTLTVPTTGPATGVDGWSTYDEYGNPTAAAATPLEESGIGYGWVGSKQRSTQGHGLTLMGARVYNAVVGQFTSRDPIFGGNSTTYAYPQDPQNGYDLTGTMGFGFPGIDLGWQAAKIALKVARKGLKIAGKACGAVPNPALSVACTMLVGALGAGIGYYLSNHKDIDKSDMAMAMVVGAGAALWERYGRWVARLMFENKIGKSIVKLMKRTKVTKKVLKSLEKWMKDEDYM